MSHRDKIEARIEAGLKRFELLEARLVPARILASLPDGYTLEVWTAEKEERVRQDSLAQHKAMGELRKAVRAIEEQDAG